MVIVLAARADVNVAARIAIEGCEVDEGDDVERRARRQFDELVCPGIQ